MSCVLKNGKKVRIYFAHTYHSWERGSNENYNRIIRRRFPIGTDFNDVTNIQLNDIVNRINYYPRKQFNFETSLNRFKKELMKININLSNKKRDISIKEIPYL